MKILETLMNLSSETGVSGSEKNVAELVLSYLKEYDKDSYISHGNVFANIGEREPGKPHILLDAHIDQIGLIVTYITEDGFIKVGNCGGLDARLTAAQQVTIHGKYDIRGVIASLPPHLSDESEEEVSKIENVVIDAGMSKEELEKIVSLGDRITFVSKFCELLDGKVTGGALDDRAGVTAILAALDIISKNEIPCSLTVLFSTQEEIGERGAKIAAFAVNPDIAIAVDVGFGFTEGEERSKCGILGNGGMIGISPSLDNELSDDLVYLAEKAGIPFQFEVMNGLSGTNADQFSVSGNGVRAVTLSIPLKYMHTPVEVVDISDVENVGKLLAEFVINRKI